MPNLSLPSSTIYEQLLILGCALQDCFLLDTGSGVYVWIGSGSSKQEKVKSMEMAGQFCNISVCELMVFKWIQNNFILSAILTLFIMMIMNTLILV